MLRPFWQSVKDRVYNAITSAFRTQPEIDDTISDLFSDVAHYGPDPSVLSPDFTRRRREFLSPDDVRAYIDDGPPPDYCAVIYHLNGDGYGNVTYTVYISDGS